MSLPVDTLSIGLMLFTVFYHCHTAQVLLFLTTARMDSYTKELGRLESFTKTWPHPDDSLCSRETMAKAGFLHVGVGDLVRCFVCRVELDNWEPESDDPWKKHIEYSPNCLFAKLGKEEGKLTVEQFINVLCAQAEGKLDAQIEYFEELISESN